MEKLFFFCAVFGSALLVMQFIMACFGLESDGDLDGGVVDGDVNIDTDGDGFTDVHHNADASGSMFLRAFTVKTVTAGAAFFGLVGMACRMAGMSIAMQLILAALAGLIALYGVYFLIRSLSSFNYNGSIRSGSAIGTVGNVYLTIPGSRQGMGKVSIVQQGRSMEYDAVTDAAEPLKTGTPIVVLQELNSSLLLVKEQTEKIELKK